MTQSLWSKGLCSPSSICLDGCTPEHLASVHLPPASSDSDMQTLPDRPFHSNGSTLQCSSLGYLSWRRHASRAAAHCAHHDRAKRARVENIIKGMTCPDVAANEHVDTEHGLEDDAEEEVALREKHVERSGPQIANQSQMTGPLLQRHHQHLWAGFCPVDGTAGSWEGGKYSSCSDSPEASPGWRMVTPDNHFRREPERIKMMADILKYELSRAVSRSVDSIFRSMPLLQTPPDDPEGPVTCGPLRSAAGVDNAPDSSGCGTERLRVPDVQTEALSLVVQKPRPDRSNETVPQSRWTPPLLFGHEDRAQERKPGGPDQQPAGGCPQEGRGQAGQSSSGARWNSLQVKSKVTSRPVRSPQSRTVPGGLPGGLCPPQVKSEPDGLMTKNSLYMLNVSFGEEGLSTNHLKKAKLMFFYTRYPSSLVLRMCFQDVQFTRCITSQLIKWFSNFREFYYIQMEKFARSAVLGGSPVLGVSADRPDLSVGRESELFRALNLHYNKANDFQVPDRFLEVAEITLREFYVAISMGRDRDPSWKKAIYKVICKLDSDVPAEFNRQACG
ncbi:unnamed protein product [Menidia menidia]|uniref:(Atlantic silverside) hypothetical protein n=1 Tax=Menidia menidia TaxID=238744 RepID=A0A8S4B7F6_9TELE|nr:unnamed protein product [Menidia menidia]